jgi:hypothetical protein
VAKCGCMNFFALILFLCCAVALLTVPRRWAPVPLLVGCCYMTMGQGIVLGGLSLPIYRMLLFVGLLRLFTKRERIHELGNAADKCMFALMGTLFLASFFHDSSLGSGGPVYACGFIFNIVSVYFLIRAWCRDLPEVAGVIVFTAFLMAPIALEMLMERVIKINQFAVFGGIPMEVLFREGSYRAQGPFRHPILAGTVGAVCFPLFVGIWKRNRLAAMVGTASGFCMIVTSGSSGPIMSLMAGVFAVMMWRFRHFTRHARWAAVVAYFAMQLKMGRPGYFVMSRINLTGGSTGYFRALLIDSAIMHIKEWWLFGTDVTRHWMATGVSFSPYHTDITNYYLAFGVEGGLPAMFSMIAVLVVCFRWVGVIWRIEIHKDASDAFLVWCLGAGLFTHAITSVSVSYFDQSLVFFWMNIAIISSMHAAISTKNDMGNADIGGFE